jgi:hypothetical protein
VEIPIVSEDDDTDIIGFEVEGHTSDTGSELHHFSGLDFVESDHTSDTITNTNDSAVLFDIILGNHSHTTWLMLRILSWITFAVSAIPNLRLEKGILSLRMFRIIVLVIKIIIKLIY